MTLPAWNSAECSTYAAESSHGQLLKYDLENSGMSVVPVNEARLVTAAPTIAALKRSVLVTIVEVMKPPYDQPLTASWSGSATPRSTSASTPFMMSS